MVIRTCCYIGFLEAGGGSAVSFGHALCSIHCLVVGMAALGKTAVALHKRDASSCMVCAGGALAYKSFPIRSIIGGQLFIRCNDPERTNRHLLYTPGIRPLLEYTVRLARMVDQPMQRGSTRIDERPRRMLKDIPPRRALLDLAPTVVPNHKLILV